MKLFAIIMLSLLALAGGIFLTLNLPRWIKILYANIQGAFCKPCTCGSNDIVVALANDGRWLFLCPRCKRFVMGRHRIKRWNEGETDGNYLPRREEDDE